MYPGEDSEYFSWLCRRVCNQRDLRRHGLLLHVLYSTEFVAKMPLDENRIGDVAILREEYEEDIGYMYSDIPDYPCSILELLITLSDRIVNIMGDYDTNSANWFWIILRNLLDDVDYFDNNSLRKASVQSELKSILRKFVDRKYSSDGLGGLFPLNIPDRDQRRVEIWYQMQSYLNENYPD